jgi:chromosome segregation ATPase
MIEYVLLIILGFFIGGLVALLIAPTVWRRAVNLTTRRLEATLPMSLADIEADKDTLRAFYAVQIRRLETSLNKAREKSAGQLVEISKLQMNIATLNDQIAMLHKQLDERSNAANVFEKTIKKRLPELDEQLTAARAALAERAHEISDFSVKLRRSEEMQTLAQDANEQQQDEIRQLRDALEKSGGENAGRFKKRPAEWSLNEYRSEYDRLSLELSKMREQLALSLKHESRQSTALKAEMQQLAERLMSSATVPNSPSPPSGTKHAPSSSTAPSGDTHSVSPSRDTSPQRTQDHDQRSLAAPQPWPKNRASSISVSE